MQNNENSLMYPYTLIEHTMRKISQKRGTSQNIHAPTQ